MRILTVKQVIGLRRRLIQATGGLDGVRDVGLIESSLSSAFTPYFGVDHYPSIEEIIELVKKLQDILTAKQVPVLEQIDRINDLLLEAKLEDQKDEILQRVY